MCTLSNDYSLSISHSIFLRESVCMSEFRGHCSQLHSTFESIIWYLSITRLSHIIQYTDTKPSPPAQNTRQIQLSIVASLSIKTALSIPSHLRIRNATVVSTTKIFVFSRIASLSWNEARLHHSSPQDRRTDSRGRIQSARMGSRCQEAATSQ